MFGNFALPNVMTLWAVDLRKSGQISSYPGLHFRLRRPS
jgi:hypothetical protein